MDNNGLHGLNVLSLFDGISCGMVALKRAGFTVNNYYAFEIDKNAIKCSASNYPSIIQCGNVFDTDFSNFENIDLIVGGSPCTFWSVIKAGREITSDGEGFKLFSKYAEAVEKLRPKYFLYENNDSIHPDIKTEISSALGVEYEMINSKFFSAQSRKRDYWTNIPILPYEDKGILLQDVLEFGTTQRHKSKTVRVGGRGSGWGNKHEWDMPNPDRQYTITELERLQTLPDGYTRVLTERQASKAIGNGWTVEVISHILSGMEFRR